MSFDLLAGLLLPTLNHSLISGTRMCGVRVLSIPKLTVQTAWTMPAAQFCTRPDSSGDGRLRHRVAVISRQT
jgi:hypothetical protein